MNGARDGVGHSSVFAAFGFAYPSDLVDNVEFLARCEFPITDDPVELVRQTRMRTRRWCAPGENTWTLAKDAATMALAAREDLADQIDVVVAVSGSTMPVVNPPEADNAGMGDLSPLLVRDLVPGAAALAIDVKAVYCSGFLRALQVMDGLLQNPAYRAGLIVAAEQGGRIATSPDNRSTFCFLLGDAAGAVVLERSDYRPGIGLIDYLGHADASLFDVAGFGPDGNSAVMKGSRAATATHEMLVASACGLLERNHLEITDVDWVVPIQTHAGIVDGLRDALRCPPEKLIWAGDRTGFSGSASIPAILSQRYHDGAIGAGDLVLSVAVGAGLNCAGALYRV